METFYVIESATKDLSVLGSFNDLNEAFDATDHSTQILCTNEDLRYLQEKIADLLS